MALKRRLRTLAAAVPLLAVLLLAVQHSSGWRPWQSQPVAALQLDCPELHAGCTFTLDGKTFTLQSDQPLRPATVFTLTLDGPVREASAEWQMRGMDMVPNSARFTVDDGRKARLRTALPYCSAARNDWLLRLSLDGHIVEVATNSSVIASAG